MNDGMYTNIRNYLEEIASKQGQIVRLLEQMTAAQGTPTGTVNTAASAPVKKDAPLTGTLETEPPPDAIGPLTVETVKEEPLKTTETVEVKDKAPDAFISAVTQSVDTSKSKPAVPRHETTPPVEGLAGFAQPPKTSAKKGKSSTSKPDNEDKVGWNS